MRTFRPHPKSVIVAGVLAVSLVVAATSGSVAARLITSHDIQDGTIKKADLSDKVNKALQKKGATGATGAPGAQGAPGEQGPQGVAGPKGPAGSSGSNGRAGVDGDGTLTGWDLYDTAAGDTAPLTISNPLYTLCAGSVDPADVETLCGDEDITLDLPRTEPASGNLSLSEGTYLVTLRTLSPTLGIWVPQLSTDSGLASTTGAMGACVSLFIPCETTFPVVVPSGGAQLNLYVGDILGALGDICGCTTATADPQASLSAVSVATGAGVTQPSVPDFQQVANALVGQVTTLIAGIIPGPSMRQAASPARQTVRTLQRQYLN